MIRGARKILIYRVSAALLLVQLFCGYRPAPRIVWLDELDLSLVDQSAGKALANQSMWKTPLYIAGVHFERGVGTHAASVFRIRLDGSALRFNAAVGLDDSPPEFELQQASAEFLVIGDGRVLWRSGIVHGREKARPFSVSLKGIRLLILKVDHAGDGITGDRADWVNAFFEIGNAPPVAVQRAREKEYITAPAASKKPLINAPYVYGARAGSPFLFTIPVSGQRPMRIITTALPEGITIDNNTGILSGEALRNGSYKIKVMASNSYGNDRKELTIEIGDRICLTPPMGWNSWNVFGAEVTDRKIRKMADALVEQGLTQYGYSYINIDDGWQGQRGGKFNAIMPNDKFPDMKALVDYVHSKGLKIGIYSSPWVQTFAGFVGGSADTREGKVINPSRRYGAFSFVKNDVQQWAEWGFDYVKYDWVTNDIAHTAELSYLLRYSGKDMVCSISNAAPFEEAEDWSRLTNLWRTTGDIHDSWCSMTTIGFLQNKWQPFAGPGRWNDPDMLVVGKLGWGKQLQPTRLSPDEQYTHISLWSLLAAPLLLGCDLMQLDSFTLSLLINNEIIAVNQDVAGIQGKHVNSDKDKETEVWSKPLSDGRLAVGLFNRSDTAQVVAITWKELEIQGARSVRDLWRQKNVGIYKDQYRAMIPAHGVVVVTLSTVISAGTTGHNLASDPYAHVGQDGPYKRQETGKHCLEKIFNGLDVALFRFPK